MSTKKTTRPPGAKPGGTWPRTPRPKGTGSVTYDWTGERWVASLDTWTPDGQRKPVRRTAQTEAEVEKKLTVLLREKNIHGNIQTGVPTFEEWVTYWLENVCTVRPTTMRTYRSSINRHLLPALGKKRLDKIDSLACLDTINGIKKFRSFYTAQTAWAVLAAIFRDAHKYKKVRENPMFVVDKPKGVKPKLRALSLEEARALVLAEPDDNLKMLWACALYTGMRRGELCGLTWDHVDDDHLDISRQLVRVAKGYDNKSDVEYIHVRGQLFLSQPKTDAGERLIPLVGSLADTLRAWRDVSGGEGFVFQRTEGGPFEPVALMPLWKAACERIGIKERVRLHDARHTAIELMFDAKVPERVIIEIVGHSAVIESKKYRTKFNRVEQGIEMSKFSAYMDGEQALLPAPVPLALEAPVAA